MFELQLNNSKELSDQYSLLKFKVARQLALSPNKAVTLGVTSYDKREGVSSVVVNLALALSQTGNTRILVVDAKPNNIAKSPMLKNIKKRANSEPPATNPDPVFEAGDEIALNAKGKSQLIHTESNFDIILIQGKKQRSQQSFDVDTFKLFLEKARDQYNLIIIDSPAIRENSFASLISSSLDGMILVIEAGRVRREALKRAIGDLRAMGANLLGVVLNKRRYPIPNFVYRWIR